jgi:hypothetical protein
MRLRLTLGLVLLALLLVGWGDRAEAQRVAPVAVSTARTSVLRRAQSLHAPVLALRVAPASRAQHVAWGAVAGAVVGGVVGLLIDQGDHTGEGLTAPVMIGGGAVLGACLGALVGAVVPTS